MVPVNKERFGNKRLLPLRSYSFLAGTPYCDVFAGEFANIVVNHPTFFVMVNEVIRPVALLALQEGDNLFVEKDGSWSGFYIPAVLRRHPFSIEMHGDAPVLTIDEDCGLLSDTEGEPLFGDGSADEMNTPVGRAIQLLTQIDAERTRTLNLTGQLAEAGLLTSTAITLQSSEGQTVLEGLMMVDEGKLNALDDAAFLNLRRSGALALASMHLFSMGQVARLEARLNFRKMAPPDETAGTEALRKQIFANIQ